MSSDFPSAPNPGGTPAASAPATGLVYADVPNRIIAYILDAILVGLFTFVVGVILAGIGLTAMTVNPDLSVSVNYGAAFVQGVLGLLISAGYFIYTWTRMRATLGMRALGMQVGNAGDGATMTTGQGVRRYVALSAPAILAQVFTGIPLVGVVVGLAGFIWYIWLIYTTAQSPTKQGWHDTFANTQVVKAARSV
ncbi:MAG: RDD family protein [Chloroflexota bacterium]